MPSFFGLIRRSLIHHWRMHLAVGMGVLAGVAVLAGALLVGDSVRGSLREMTLDRLGTIDQALISEHFFRQELPAELANRAGFSDTWSAARGWVLLQASLSQVAESRSASQVTVVGRDEDFWSIWPGIDPPACNEGEIILNSTVAKELEVAVGDEVILRLPQAAEIPPDSPLGNRSLVASNLRIRVGAVIEDRGPGAFSLRPSQQATRVAILPRHVLQTALERPNQINAIVLTRAPGQMPSNAEQDEVLARLFSPTLEDLGLRLEEDKNGIVRINSERMLLEPAVVEAIDDSLDKVPATRVLTYLANSLNLADKSVPYSTVSSLDGFAGLGAQKFSPAEADQPILPPGEGEILLNQWTAEQLAAKVGDQVQMTFFEPESTHGELREQTEEFRVSGILAMQGAAVDDTFTPTLKGVTDQLTMANWNPPFPFESERIRPVDEDYWRNYRATPKAFVSLADARRLWGSRFGDLTSVRFAGEIQQYSDRLASALQTRSSNLGLNFRAVRRLGLQAAAGTTPFDLLFFGFSMFLIAAAIILVVLLFQLGMDRRRREVGIMRAVGWQFRRIRNWLWLEAVFVALIGGLLGALVAVAYASGMLWGLRTLWVAAISTPFVRLYVTPTTLLIGSVAGIVMTLAAIAWSLWRMRKESTRGLMANATAPPRVQSGARRWISSALAIGSLFVALLVGFLATRLNGEAQAGAFFGSGALTLVALLAGVWRYLRGGGTTSLYREGKLWRLAARNGARHPGRSALTIGLIAAASFVIVAIGAFTLAPPKEIADKNSSSGGYSLVAESDKPIHQDLSNPEFRQYEIGIGTQDEKHFQNVHIYSLAVQNGDDASCRNLYRPEQPKVLGATESFVRRGGFEWGSTLAQSADEKANPWMLLDRQFTSDEDQSNLIPVVIDQNTAVYSLHLGGGAGSLYEMPDGQGGKLKFKVVGLLKNSLLQGALVISLDQFREHFPKVSGYRFFLIEAPPEETDQIATILERELTSQGFDVQPTVQRLAGFFAVQNTYLITFQTLGGLGLLLGTLGVAVVQLRNVLERRGELALLRAVGFRRSRLVKMILWENTLLLAAGLLIGIFAALVAVLPQWIVGNGSIPWVTLLVTMGLVLVVSWTSCLAAVRAVVRTPLLPALRQE